MGHGFIYLAAGAGYQLPSTLGHATTSTGTGLISLIISGSNLVLGVFGLAILVVGIFRLLKELWGFYQGKSEGSKYTPGFTGSMGKSIPPMLVTVIDILVGFVVVGLVMSGAWVGIVDALIGIGAHVGNQVSSHLSTIGGGTTGTGG